MQPLKSGIGVVSALLPVIYCGGLAYYFFSQSGSWENAKEIGLGPTVLGLTIVGILFCIPLIWKIVSIFAQAHSAAITSRSGSRASAHNDDGEFDADAVIARHMARRSADPTANAPTPPPPQGGASPGGFGRRGR